MDYEELAVRLLDTLQSLHKKKPPPFFNEALQGEAFVLHYIALRGGHVLPGEIGHEMGVSTARVAAALNSLEKKGLITRRIDTGDRRKILVEITEEGKAFTEKQYRAVIGGITKMLALLGERDANEYIRIMGKLAEMAPGPSPDDF